MPVSLLEWELISCQVSVSLLLGTQTEVDQVTKDRLDRAIQFFREVAAHELYVITDGSRGAFSWDAAAVRDFIRAAWGSRPALTCLSEVEAFAEKVAQLLARVREGLPFHEEGDRREISELKDFLMELGVCLAQSTLRCANGLAPLRP